MSESPVPRVYARIAGTGSYLPAKVLTNDDLAKFVDTSDEWIAARTGIRQRHVAAEGETTGDLAVHAALRALEAAGTDASEIERRKKDKLGRRSTEAGFGRDRTKTYLLGGAENCGKAQPGQIAPVSHGCPVAVFEAINVLNTEQESHA